MSDEALFGTDLFGDAVQQIAAGVNARRFGHNPVSVLDGRSGLWSDRKRAWQRVAPETLVARRTDGANALGGLRHRATVSPGACQEQIRALANKVTFDPVLAELVYSWFARPQWQVVDPFAGGMIRGACAGVLGLRYWGCDLSEEQVAINRVQITAVPVRVSPEWVVGDAQSEIERAPLADLLFSCPPYGDLEVYSDDPRDLSAMGWTEFGEAYRSIVSLGVARLRSDRFAVFVVGDVRAPDGSLRNLPGLTVDAFAQAGCCLYNAAVIVPCSGSAGMRAAYVFPRSRKLLPAHQHVLVFCKGSWRAAVDAITEAETCA